MSVTAWLVLIASTLLGYAVIRTLGR